MAAVSLQSFGQGNLQRKNVTFVKDSMSLMDVFREVQMQVGFMFVFQPTLVDQFEDLRIPIGTFTVQDALDIILESTPVGFEENGRNIIIFRKPVDFEVRGVVVAAETGDPLPGASIRIKDSNKGVQTDSLGRFSMRVTKNDELQISFVGRLSTRRVITKAADLKIELQPILLTEVTVNAGYYKLSNEFTVGNIGTVSREILDKSPGGNFLQSFPGNIPGVYNDRVSGLPGGAFTIKIRGQNSLRKDGNEPLYLVNGVPFPSLTLSSKLTADEVLPDASPLSVIDPWAIERIDVLKDADATAIYGSRGANGVVLITTRQPGKKGLNIDADAYWGISQVGHRMKLLNTTQWLVMRNEAFRNDRAQKTKGNARDLLVWDTTRYTDWQDVLIGGAAELIKGSVMFSGGDDLVTFNVSGSLHNEGSVFPGSFNYRRAMVLGSFKVESTEKRLSLAFSASYSNEANELPSTDLTLHAIQLSPVAPALVDEHGNINWANGSWRNPLALMRQTYRAQTSNLMANATLSYRITDELKAKVSIGFQQMVREETTLEPLSSHDPAKIDEQTGTNYTSNASVSTRIIEPQLDYTRWIGKGELQVLVGSTLQSTLRQGRTVAAYGFTSDGLIHDIAAAASLYPSESVYSDYRYAAVFGRANYTWQRKYVLNLTARRDGSSRFGPGNQFQTFGAAGVAWIIKNEPFMDELTLFSSAKARFTIGTTGNDQIPDHGYMGAFTAAPNEYLGSAIVPTRLASPTYSWETTGKMEVGLLLGFLQNRIELDISAYRNVSYDQLLGRPLPYTTGFTTVQYNLPSKVENKGLELTLSTIQLDRKSVSWRSTMNLTIPRNKLLSYDGISSSGYANQYSVGKSLDVSHVLRYRGIDPATGDFVFDDKNGNGTYDIPDDLYPFTIARVHYFGGVDNLVTLGKFQLSILLQFTHQTKASYQKYFPNPGAFTSNQPNEVMNRWQHPGDVATGHRFTQNLSGFTEYNKGVVYGDQAYANASFIRLRNISISYQVDKHLAERIGMKGLRVYIQGQNIYTFTDYVGFDPDSVDPFALPPLRTISAGLHLEF